jgi:hypothetical protein
VKGLQNMVGIRKKFDRPRFLKSDPQSRKVVKEYYKKQGIVLNDNPNRFGIDLISEDGSLQIELEHRPPWKDECFPYSDVNIMARKQYLQDGNVDYIILSRDFKKLGIIKGKDLKPYIVDTNLHHHRNKDVYEGEYVYKIPVEKFKWVTV